jgi:hypothetical protein
VVHKAKMKFMEENNMNELTVKSETLIPGKSNWDRRSENFKKDR